MNIKINYISIFLFFIGLILTLIGNSISYALDINNLEQIGNINTLKSIDNNIIDIKLSFIGDSLLASYKGEKYPDNFQDLLDNNNYSYPFKNVSKIFKEDDYTIANGENVFTDNNLLPIEKNHNPAYWYRSSKKYANIYRESSIEIVSVMNNHSYDYGYSGFIDTMDALEKAGVIYGEEKPVIIEKNGIKIAIICINLFSSFQYENCVKEIKKVKPDVNYVIVYFHGGTEYLFKPTTEIVEYCHGFIDNGADLVVGCHPHVLEPIEYYNNKKIVYSLGSFIFGGTKNLVNRTIIYQINLKFDLYKNKIIEEENIIPCYLYTGTKGYESWIPSIIQSNDEKQKVIDFMKGIIEKPV